MIRFRPRPGDRARVGLALLIALVAVTLLSGLVHDASPRDYLGSLALLVAAVVVGRLAAGQAWVVAVAVVVGFVGWVLLTPGSLAGGPTAGPLGYANANAALAVQVAAVVLVASARTPHPLGRWLLLLAALGPLAVVVPNRSSAAAVGAVALLVTGLVVTVRRPRRARVVLATCTVLVLLAALGQVLLAASGAGSAAAASAVSERRVELWQDAAELARSAPLAGHGPGSFSTLSPTAAADPDTREAHSALLEVAAELGLVAAALMLALALWVFWALGWGPAPAAVVAAVGWAAFCGQALVDYVADFPAVLAAAGLAVGLGIGRSGQRRSRSLVVLPDAQNSSMSPSVSDHPPSAGG